MSKCLDANALASKEHAGVYRFKVLVLEELHRGHVVLGVELLPLLHRVGVRDAKCFDALR